MLYTLMQSPTVSGAQSYRELCITAKKEKRLVELRNMQQYIRDANLRTESFAKGLKPNNQEGSKYKGGWNKGKSISYQKSMKFYLCDCPNH